MRSSSSKNQRARSWRWLTRAGGAFFVSACAHAVAAVTVGVVIHTVARSPADPPEMVAIDLAPGAELSSELAASASADEPLRANPRTNTMSALPRVAAGRKATVLPARGLSATGTGPIVGPPANTPDGPDTPARFVLHSGTVSTGPASSSRPAPSASAAQSVPDSDVASEGDVNVPARLLSASPLVYPSAARKAEIEIDFPLEIIVDVDGHVLSAHAVGRAGYGLDEAALRAIRAYRFSPALRAGRAVRVRMRWTVQFRLS